MTRYSDDRAAVLPDLFYQFGEPVKYGPAAGGGSRQITAIVDEEEAGPERGEVDERDQELIWVLVRRDESHVDGGIARPSRGDALWRAGDAESAPWVFTGRRRDEEPDRWTLQFARSRQTAFQPRRAD